MRLLPHLWYSTWLKKPRGLHQALYSIIMDSINLETSKQTDDSGGILQTFWGLSSLEEGEQLQSAKLLITSLQKSQEACGDEEICSDIQYTVKRLVRGLASNRKGARQGYFISLTELLSVSPAIPVSQVLQLIRSHLEPTGGDKAAEERGLYFGKLFALLALIKSGRVNVKEDIVNVAQQLHTCYLKKNYLREFCYISIAHLVDLCHSQGNDDIVQDEVIPIALDTEWDGCTVEQLFLYLHMNNIYGKEKWFRKYLSKKLGSKSLLGEGCIERLAPVLMESTSAHPRLHNVWALVLEGVRGSDVFEPFWKTVVDDSLFSSSHERRYLGFKLLESLLPSLTVSEVAITFSPNLLSCLLNNSAAEDNYLHLAAKHLLAEMSALVTSSTDRDLLIALYIHLKISTHNKFDQLCGVKFTEQVLTQLSVEGVGLLLDRLTVLLCHPSQLNTASINGDGTDTHSVQLWAVDHILLILRQRKLPQHSSWILKATKTLLLFSLFQLPSSSKKPLPQELLKCTPDAPLSSSIRTTLSQRLSSSISDLSSMALTKNPPSNSKNSNSDAVGEDKMAATEEKGQRRWTTGIPGVMEDGGYFLSALVKYVDELTNDGLSLVEELAEDVLEAWATSIEHVASLTSKESLTPEERAFLLLFSATGLQLLTSTEERDAMSKTVQELSICFNEMSQSLGMHKRRTPKKAKGPGPGSGSGWMAVLTDVLLGLLSHSSQLWRNVVEQVFKQLTHCVTADSLKLILEVLEPKQSKDDIMEVDGEEGSDSGDSGSEAGDGSDVSDVSEAGDGSDVSDASDGGDSGDDSSVGGVEVVDPLFRADIRKALGAAGMDSDVESGGSVDDEVMISIDEDLAEVFRTRFALTHQKKAKKDEEKSVVHFKLRVLGLVEAFIRKETTNPLVLEVVVPLYEVIQGAQNRKDHAPLVEKAKGIFKNRLCHMKEYPKANIDLERIHDNLHQLVDHLNKANTITAPLLTQSFLLLIRVLRGNATSAPLPAISPLTTRSGRKRKKLEPEPQSLEHGDLNVDQVTDWLASALSDFVTKKNSNINPVFFSTYIERYPSLGIHLAPKLIELLPLSSNYFRKTQMYEMLAVLRGHVSGESPFDKLATEDLEAMDALTSKSKKRKRSKHKK